MAVLLGSREGARQRGLTAKEIIGANAGRPRQLPTGQDAQVPDVSIY
jgi:hypothetical protein